MNDIMDENEVAAMMSCEPGTIQEKARLGELPALKFGRSWRFPRQALMEALNAQAHANKPPPPKPLGSVIRTGRKGRPKVSDGFKALLEAHS